MFYLPHRTVIRESAKTTKLRTIYDASSKPTTKSSASLHDLKDLPLQNSMWDVLVRSRFKPSNLVMWWYQKSILTDKNGGVWEKCFAFSLGKKCNLNGVKINRFLD